MTRAATTLRTFAHDAGGNPRVKPEGKHHSDTRSGTAYAYTYNKRNRLNTVTVAASLNGTYTYNAKEQLAIRVTSNMTPSGTTHFIHDLNGNVIAETAGNGPTGATGTVREYIYLPETEIAPAADGRTRVDRPLAVVNAVNTATPATYYVHSLPRRRPGSITLGSSPRASLNRPSCRRQASNRVDDGRYQSPSLGGGVAGVGWLVLDHRPAGQRYAVSGTVVPVRIRLALQLAPALRSINRSLHPTRPTRLRRWSECVWVCEIFTSFEN